MVAIKAGRRLLLGSFIGTALLFAAWASTYYTEPQLATTLAFATFFFLLYAAAPLLGRRRAPEVSDIPTSDRVGAAQCRFLFRGQLPDAGRALPLRTGVAHGCDRGLFFVLTRLLQSAKDRQCRCTVRLYLALGVGFLTVAIPLKLEGYWNTLGWIVEAGALFWAAHRSGSLLLRILGAARSRWVSRG